MAAATRRGLVRLVAARLLAVALIATAAFVAASPARAQVEDPDPETVSGTLARIKSRGVVRIGYREAAIPFSFLGRGDQPVGYSLDLCQAIVDEIGRTLDREDLKVEFVRVTAEDRIDAVADGRIDLECGSTTNTLERAKRVAFSPMIFVTGTKVMVPVATRWRDFRDLKGKKVAVTRGTTNAEALAALDKKFNLGITIVEGAGHEESYQLLVSGAVDAFATDEVLLYGLIAQHKSQDKFKVVGELLSYEPYGIMFARNQPVLREVVTRALRNMVIARDIGPTYDKWFSSRLPNGERFNIPMSPQLDQSFTILGSTGEAN
jgi:glutamate/aspartate transport system substrate-binding protein